MEWISVNDRMPKNGKRVLALFPELDRYFVQLAVYHDGVYEIEGVREEYGDMAGWYFCDGDAIGEVPPLSWRVTHWMPLPDPPKGE